MAIEIQLYSGVVVPPRVSQGAFTTFRNPNPNPDPDSDPNPSPNPRIFYMMRLSKVNVLPWVHSLPAVVQ